MDKFYYSQGPWYVIKDFLGVYGVLTAEDYETLRQVEPEQIAKAIKYNLDWRSRSLVCPYILPIRDENGGPINFRDTISEVYYALPEVQERMAEINVHMKALGFAINMPPSIRTEALTADVREKVLKGFREKSVVDGIRMQEAARVDDMESVRMHILSCKNREMFEKLHLVAKNPKQWCACGELVTMKAGRQQNHFKSALHCTGVYQRVNEFYLESLFQQTGNCPPGFTRTGEASWRHIIPDDPKRKASHPISLGTGDFDLGQQLCKDPQGVSWNRPVRAGLFSNA